MHKPEITLYPDVLRQLRHRFKIRLPGVTLVQKVRLVHPPSTGTPNEQVKQVVPELHVMQSYKHLGQVVLVGLR